MIFDVPFLVRYLSQFMVLRPGDVVELEIDLLGRQWQVYTPAL